MSNIKTNRNRVSLIVLASAGNKAIVQYRRGLNFYLCKLDGHYPAGSTIDPDCVPIEYKGLFQSLPEALRGLGKSGEVEMKTRWKEHPNTP